MQYNDTLPSNINDEEREKLLVEEIAELVEDNIDCILAVPTTHYERVIQLLQNELLSTIQIETINIPEKILDLQEDTLVYRETEDKENEELMDCHIDNLYALLGRLLREDVFEKVEDFSNLLKRNRDSLN